MNFFIHKSSYDLQGCSLVYVLLHCRSSFMIITPDWGRTLPCWLVARSWRLWHDDVIIWKHFPRYWPFVRGIHRSPVNSPHKGQWRGALMLSLICVWINGWVNNREAGDLRRYRAHYDVTVMVDGPHIWLQNICVVLKIRTIRHARGLWKLARSCKQL